MKWNQYKAKEALLSLIKGKEKQDTAIMPSQTGISSVCKIKIFIPGNDYTKLSPGFIGEHEFEVHADTRASVITDFLNAVSDENICLAKGDKGALRIGIKGIAPDYLFIYLKKK